MTPAAAAALAALFAATWFAIEGAASAKARALAACTKAERASGEGTPLATRAASVACLRAWLGLGLVFGLGLT